MRQRGGQWKPQQMQDGWVLSGLAGSRGRAELCLPPSSAALSGFFCGPCQSRGLGCSAMGAGAGIPWGNVSSTLWCGNPACPSLRAEGCWGVIPITGEQPSGWRDPLTALPVIPVLPHLLAPHVQHEAGTG